MRWVGLVLLVVVVLIVVVYVVGMLLPVSHVASVGTSITAPPEQVFARLADVNAGPEWRSDVDSVEVLSAPGEPLRWRETGGFGAITFVREQTDPPRRLVSRIDGRDQGFGGRWTWELRPGSAGTDLSVTEEGEVYSPLFRFMSRFVFGHYRTMETVVGDLAHSFGAEAAITRLR